MSEKGEGNRGPRFGGLFFYLIMLAVLVVFSTIVFGGNYGKKEQADNRHDNSKTETGVKLMI